MRVDQVIRDPRRTLQEVLRAFDNNLTARDNFAPEGQLHQVLMSNGPDRVPSYQSLTPDIMDVYTKEQVDELLGSHKHAGEDIISGQVGPQFLGTGTRDGTNFLRDDGAYSKVPWGSLTGVPTDFKGYGLDDDILAALAPYSRIGHTHHYDSLYGLPTVTGVTTDDLMRALIGYSTRGHRHTYDELLGTPPAGGGGGLTEADVRNMLIGYSPRSHNHVIEEEEREWQYLLAGQIFGG